MKRFLYGRNNKIFSEKHDYSEFKNLMFDTALGTEKVSTEAANKKIREIMFDVLGIDATSSRKDIRRAFRKNKLAVFEVIEELVPNLLKTGWQDNPFFMEFVEFRSADEGDTNEFYVEDEVILTVSELSGNHHDLVRQRLGEGSTYSVKTSWYGIKIYAEYEHFMTGKVDWARFIQKVYEAFDQKVNSMLYTAFMEAGDKVLPADQFTKTIQMVPANEETIITLADDVATVNGAEAVIMGTKVALSKLTKVGDVSWASNEMKQERNTLGRLGMWNGIRLVEIPQAFAPNDTTNKLVDNNRLLVMPVGDNKFIKMFDEGDAVVNETTDRGVHMDMTVDFEYQQKMGVATVINKKFGQIKIQA